jgi:hypothetical protein
MPYSIKGFLIIEKTNKKLRFAIRKKFMHSLSVYKAGIEAATSTRKFTYIEIGDISS